MAPPPEELFAGLLKKYPSLSSYAQDSLTTLWVKQASFDNLRPDYQPYYWQDKAQLDVIEYLQNKLKMLLFPRFQPKPFEKTPAPGSITHRPSRGDRC